MINPDLTSIASLKEWYETLSKMQREAHGEGYTDHHNMMKEIGLQSMKYKECGVNQGTTAAAAIFAGARHLELIDIRLNSYKPYEHLFKTYAKENGIFLKSMEASSTSRSSVSNVDFLLLDTIHRPHHLRSELILHGPSVSKYIMVHDTYSKRNLKTEVDKYCDENPEWKIVEDNQRSVGFTLMEKAE